MDRKIFHRLFEERIVMLDGATGSNLMQAGMPVGVCPEKWILEHPQHLIKLQRAYIQAGTNILLAPTFTANRIKLAEYHLEDKIREMNMQLVDLTRTAIAQENHRGFIAGDMTMTGRQLQPVGDLAFEELVDVYKEQAQILVEAGVDLFFVETMMSLAEARACVIAIKEVCNLPIMVSMTFNSDGKTLFGSTPEASVIVLQSLGIDAVGINCSTGPKEMEALIKRMVRYATIPVFAKPNNGMPELIDGETKYTMTPETFAEYGRALVEAGARAVGGCCGSTPKHIEMLKKVVRSVEPEATKPVCTRVLSSESAVQEIHLDGNFLVVGERINPTGKKKLQEMLRAGNMDLVVQMAEEQTERGAKILDINMDELEMMRRAVYEVISVTNLPLCIDSSHVEIIEAALRIYPGRALVNSVSLEKVKMQEILPLVRKYGAMFILLPLSDEGLPKDSDEKESIIHTVLDAAYKMGFQKEDVVVDGLVATVGAEKAAAVNCLKTIRYCHDMGLATICGLSNISFGLPERMFVNAAFLTMAIQNGLTMAIANPSQTMLMNMAYASDMLLNKDEGDIRYIQNVKPLGITTAAPVQNGGSQEDEKEKSVIKGSTLCTSNNILIFCGHSVTSF